MLVLNILPICRAKGIEHLYTFLRKQGFPHGAAHQIVNGKCLQPKLAYLEKLCILLRCTPNDILEWHPAADASKEQPMSALIPRQDEFYEWMGAVRKLPLDKLKALNEVMKGELEK